MRCPKLRAGGVDEVTGLSRLFFFFIYFFRYFLFQRQTTKRRRKEQEKSGREADRAEEKGLSEVLNGPVCLSRRWKFHARAARLRRRPALCVAMPLVKEENDRRLTTDCPKHKRQKGPLGRLTPEYPRCPGLARGP